ncbi:MAG: RIP metalloprotease RseP [Bacteroidia bacterium]
MGAATQAEQLVLSLSILVILHELGHFIPAKLFKTRIEKFYLFFDPWFSLFKFKKGETEYGIGWLPLGGYVKISGMIDESMDKEQLNQAPQPWEFRAKPAWQRLIIMIGGVTVNVLLAMFIYSMIALTWGQDYLPTQNVKYGVTCDSIAAKLGFQDGDKIISVGGVKEDNFNKITLDIILNKAKTVQVDRNGTTLNIPIPESLISNLIKKGKGVLFEPRYPCVVDTVVPNMPGIKAGLQKGDKIMAIDSFPTPFFQDIVKKLQTNKGKILAITVERNGVQKNLSATIGNDGMLGFGPVPMDKFLDFKIQNYNLITCFPAGIKTAYETFKGYLKQVDVLFTVKDAHKSIGGFISIGKAYSPVWDWQRFWSFTAFLSIMLAFLNILPIPALDGGHVLFLLIEVITGRKVPEKVLEYAQYIGMLILLALVLYANGNDVLRLFGK